MAYRFRQSDPSVRDGLRRIAQEQIDRALAEIDDPEMDLHQKVHQVRKRMKKLRGLVRLVRPVFPDYAAENAIFRDAARRISGLRDREVMIETLDNLLDPGAARFAALRAALARAQQDRAGHLSTEEEIAAVRATLIAARARVKRWRIAADGFDALSGGFAKTFKRACRAMKRARYAPTDEVIHDWRKRAKYHWYQSRLLRPIHPDRMQDRIRTADALGEVLGEHHDLAVLRRHLQDNAALPLTPEGRDELKDMIAARQAALEVQAQSLGRDLHAGRAKDLKRRLARWWKAWRKG